MSQSVMLRPPGEAPKQLRGSGRRTLLHLTAVTVGGGIVAGLFPSFMGTQWGAIGSALADVPVLWLVGLLVLWIAGLGLHSITLSAALPGLSHRRALMLSLTGSAVSNVLPLGGAAGIALNYRMSRRWGFAPPAIAAFTVVANVCDVVMKLLLPLALVPLVVGGFLPQAFGSPRVLVVVAGLMALVAVGAVVLLTREHLLHRLSEKVLWLRRPLTVAEKVASAARRVLIQAWPRLSAGMGLYTLFLLLLLVACLHAGGAHIPLALVFAAFCGERLLTMIGLTPAGLGFVELGLAGVLMLAPGVVGVDVASGILLYRLLTVGLEIPVGGALLAFWTWSSSRS
ncbi:hypothetical protein GCM10022223_33510 [Kineosporia mesophila]|uniref:Flippase-like domain-containing protein n=1 Tax=Kineosporia mesophila TaxID=566012 RepID=A0ABP6ZTD8_9ACTN|nr:lysylphosphatidylglycerol synthase domain-containing protein [Kineosporia mesophila]MCD5353664.1 flippase-like domain-containing protein [Kineosporia mesophila]